MPRPRAELVLCLCLLAPVLSAQHSWQAVLPAVEAKGLHAIRLTPELLGASTLDLRDVRLFDGNGSEVPFVRKDVVAERLGATFVPYPLERNEVQRERTVIEFQRPTERVVDVLHVRVRPVDVVKQMRVLGSDDRRQWFLVKDDHVVAQGARGDPPRQVLTIHIPPTDYPWIRLVLNDSLTAPMQILEVGHFSSERSVPTFVASGPLMWEQLDTTNETRIRIKASRPIAVDRIRFAVEDAGFFHRNVELRTWSDRSQGSRPRQRPLTLRPTVRATTISSDFAPVFDLNTTVLDTFELVIDNGNDRPLRFTDLTAFAHEHLLLAQLVPGITYHLATGDPKANAPRYDMAHFAGRLPTPVDTLVPGPLTLSATGTAQRPLFDPGSWWIWAVIVLLVAGMAAMALRMMRKME